MKYLIFLLFSLLCYAEVYPVLIKEHGSFSDLKWTKYLKKGGNEADVREVNKLQDLKDLIKETGIPKVVNTKGREHRFNFVLTKSKILRVSSFDRYSDRQIPQDLLTKGNPIIAAGEVFLFKDNKDISLTISNHSRKYCTPFKSLNAVKEKLILLGAKDNLIRLIEYPSKFCQKP